MLRIANEAHQRFAVVFLKYFLDVTQASAIPGIAGKFDGRTALFSYSLLQDCQRHLLTLHLLSHELQKKTIHNAS